ncbi:MAG: hypothetical protein PHN47_05070, partial [Clostridia bacterium]|nr:hypothetical protein [Clostridia bacterium]
NPLSVTFLVLAVLEIICAIFFRCSVNKQNRIFAGGLLRYSILSFSLIIKPNRYERLGFLLL